MIQSANGPSRPDWGRVIDQRAASTAPQPEAPQPQCVSVESLMAAVGSRYAHCKLANYKIHHEGQRQAVETSRGWAHRFLQSHCTAGESLVYLGPPGTGKDHLMVAVAMGIARVARKELILYRDGLRLFSEFKAAFDSRDTTEDKIVKKYTSAALLAISDPIPPRGTLSDYEQRLLYRIIDGRYRNRKAVAVTCNVASRSELEAKLGAQATDRLCEGATVVVCAWPSYRGAR